MKSSQRAALSHALFGVTLPCPGKCWACKTELSIIQHEQEDVWSDMGGGQGLTKPRAYRGTTLMWVCGPAELSKVQWVICKTPLPSSTTTFNTPTTATPPQLYHSFTVSLPLPPTAEPFCTLYVLLNFPLWHTLPLLLHLLLHTYINRVACTSTGECMHTRTPHGTQALSVKQTGAGSTCYR